MEFYIFVTKSCNLRCKYCFEDNSLKITRNNRKELNAEQVADFVIKNLENGRNNIAFYGGEPLLRQKWIEEFIKLTQKRNLIFTLQTNGTLLGGISDFILKNLDYIYVSFDGSKQLTDNSRGSGVYSQVLANIKKIKPKFKGKILARMTLLPENSIYDSVRHILKLNLFDCIHWQIENSSRKFDFQKTTARYEDDISKLLDFWIENISNGRIIEIVPFKAVALSIINKKQYNFYRCGAGKFLVSIDTDGNCYSCDVLLEPQFKIGDISKGIKQKKLSCLNYSKFCLGCDINKICGGRCFETSLRVPADKFNFYCDMTKILVRGIESRIPLIESFVQDNAVSLKDFEYSYFTEEIP